MVAQHYLDKMRLPATMEFVEEAAVEADHSLALDIEPLVLMALAGRARSVLHLDEQPIVIAMTGKMVVTRAVFLCVPDGELRPYTMTCSPFFGSDGELIGVANYITEAGAPGTPLAPDDPLIASLEEVA